MDERMLRRFPPSGYQVDPYIGLRTATREQAGSPSSVLHREPIGFDSKKRIAAQAPTEVA